MTRIFEKCYTRSLPLMAAQFWWEGEHDILPKLTEGEVYFSPLFIFTTLGKAEVYYDINNFETDEEKITEYFSLNPDRFDNIMAEYIDVCGKVVETSQDVSVENFKALFSLCSRFSALLAIILELGDMKGEDVVSRKLGMKAYKLREKTHTVGETACHNLLDITEKIRPGIKELSEIAVFEEIVSNEVRPSEIRKREKLFILFENSLYFSVEELERAKNIKIVR